jgi:hypothetical protein
MSSGQSVRATLVGERPARSVGSAPLGLGGHRATPSKGRRNGLTSLPNPVGATISISLMFDGCMFESRHRADSNHVSSTRSSDDA